ncbi:hypothetical protein [Granulicella sp. L46]|uniref:hypothetical protein n=1 Tax=Granulicella sp. L46 TaxID=1641865 RepID=UPI00131AD254|nr:hypothetical protein [Granulicella sp. L46]
MVAAIDKVSGFDQIVAHFGHWPSFHDAIVESFRLELKGESVLQVRTWNTLTETDQQGYFRTAQHGIVEFTIYGLSSFELGGSDLEAGCILFGLRIEADGDAYRIEFDPCLGIGGWLRCHSVSLSLRIPIEA